MAAIVEDSREQVVLLDEQGAAVGIADKALVHTTDTPLHLAFSSYLFNDRGELLLSRRAWSKKTWPGAWTNSVCGHPAPGEELAAAVRRRVASELGLSLDDLRLVLPAFRYRAVMANGIVENELCPVFAGRVSGEVSLDADEVNAIEWVAWPVFVRQVLVEGRDISPWCVEQVAELDKLGHDPAEWPASTDGLPPAALLA